MCTRRSVLKCFRSPQRGSTRCPPVLPSGLGGKLPAMARSRFTSSQYVHLVSHLKVFDLHKRLNLNVINVPTRASLCILFSSAQTRQQQTKMQHGKPTTPSIMANSKKEGWLLRLLEELQQHQDTRAKRARPLGVSRTTPKLGRSTTRKWASVSDSALIAAVAHLV